MRRTVLRRLPMTGCCSTTPPLSTSSSSCCGSSSGNEAIGGVSPCCSVAPPSYAPHSSSSSCGSCCGCGVPHPTAMMRMPVAAASSPYYGGGGGVSSSSSIGRVYTRQPSLSMRISETLRAMASKVGGQVRYSSSASIISSIPGGVGAAVVAVGEILLFYMKNPLKVYDFEAPRYITRDHVAYARCPACLHPFHMCSMKDHLTFEHAEEITSELVFLKTCNARQSEGGDVGFSGRGGVAESEEEMEALVEGCKAQVRAHIDRVCEKRLQLYESYFGSELVKTEQDVVWERKEAAKRERERLGRKFHTAEADGEDNAFFGTDGKPSPTAVPSTPKYTPGGLQIPQLNATGDAYHCCYCPPPLPGSKPQVFRTRDMLFKHVCTDHEEIDIEDIEDHIPVIVPKAAATTPAAGGAPPVPNPGAVRRPGAAQPPGIGTRPEDAAPTKDALTGLINIDRYRIDQYPCEVCGKVYGDEGDLLKHLELKHPISPSSVERNAAQMTRNPDEVVAPAGSSKARVMSAAEAAAAAKFAVAALQKQESNRGKDVMISVKCDLCVGKQKVYTSGSALLAHLMGKHPTVNAALKIKELLAIADKTESNKCPHCEKIFSTADAMQSHITTKHEGITNANTRTSVSAGNNWWCNECDKGFTSPQGLRGHQHSKHGFVTVPVKCPICKRMTSDNFACDEHIKLSHPTARWTSSSTFNCFECPRGFLSPEDRDIHMKKYHPVVEDSMMQSINEKRFGQKVKSVSRGTSSAPKPPGGMSFPAPPPPPSR